MRYVIEKNKLTADIFLKLRRESNLGPINTETVEKSLASSVMTFVATVEGKPVGMLRVVGDGALVFMIFDVLVHPDYRRSGIGSALTEAAIRGIKEIIPPGGWVQVGLFASPGREYFYRRFGFVEIPFGNIGQGMITFLKND